MLAFYALLIHTILNLGICYFTDAITFASSDVGNVLYDLDWVDFPIKEKQRVLFMIQRAQRPFYFKGNNSVVCSLQTISKVN